MFTMLLTLSLLLLLGTLATTTADSASDDAGQRLVERRYKGLKFGATAQDYILFKPRMEPLQESFSVCAWAKKMRSNYNFWIGYEISSSTNEITLSDDGYAHTFGTETPNSWRGKETQQLGTWRHLCYTWSLTSGAARLYFDGVLLGSFSTPSGRKLGLDGYMVLGQDFDSYKGGFDFSDKQAFGGVLFKVNIFDKELDASEVKDMADGGLCSEVEEKYGRSRHLKWEDLLLEEKSGNVTEIDVGCTPEPKNKDEVVETNSTEDCECEQENGTTFSRWDLLRGENFFNKTVSVELVEELKQTWEILGNYLNVSVILFFYMMY